MPGTRPGMTLLKFAQAQKRKTRLARAGLFRAAVGRLRTLSLSHALCHVAPYQCANAAAVPHVHKNGDGQKKWGALLPPKDCWGLASVLTTPRGSLTWSSASSERCLVGCFSTLVFEIRAGIERSFGHGLNVLDCRASDDRRNSPDTHEPDKKCGNHTPPRTRSSRCTISARPSMPRMSRISPEDLRMIFVASSAS
jgi:hypothetical protein